MSYFAMMDEEEHPIVGFQLTYGGELVFCEAIMQHNYFDVFFNGKWMATIAHDDGWEWMQESGIILTDDIVETIGLQIEKKYN